MRERIIQDTLRLYEEKVDLAVIEDLIDRELMRDENETDPQFRFWQSIMGVSRIQHELKQSILKELRSSNIGEISLRSLQAMSQDFMALDPAEISKARLACESIMTEVRALVVKAHIDALQTDPKESEYLTALWAMAIERGYGSEEGATPLEYVVQDLIVEFQNKLDKGLPEIN